ncbi:hypothetical protein [Nocardia yunnanensis]|nr:hypothetical protein [Nocardia yunnanensis]
MNEHEHRLAWRLDALRLDYPKAQGHPGTAESRTAAVESAEATR